ncbi:2-oxoglutarate dehydrogenase E1 component [Bacillus sp. FJAT-47783]|uniref:2-oxoglutarate dehydrogenase E1 component n=1 Tax=Bacillus sp. FJAT-47783 TaxID=2922712 RepID=UPI001FAD97A6|nr:2-oxoglutarate dehydrogenase E1 component [Bacillus sp. FJAT-47783]
MEEHSASRVHPWQHFHGPNLGYVMELYEEYLQDPSSVDPELRDMFDAWGAPQVLDESGEKEVGFTPKVQQIAVSIQKLQKVASAVKFAEDIRTYGHLNASIYPMGIQPEYRDVLDLSRYDLTKEDLNEIPAKILCPHAPDYVKTGVEAIDYLKEVYTKSIAFEFQHVHEIEEKQWLNEMVESGKIFRDLSNEKRLSILKRLSEVEGFESFLHRTFVGQKRFSIEGLDMLVPMLDELIQESVQHGTTNINIGMAHRGRLSVLAHVLGKPYELIFSEFQHAPNKELVPSEGSIGINYGWSGDVKYHLGADKQIKNDNTVQARLTLANNPSHLEFIDPIVEGYTRAAQDDRTKSGYPAQDVQKSMAVLIHGDAAFPGEGVVAETLNLSQLEGYKTGGTVHIIANNMIGFTTESRDSRSTKYASDLAKGFEIPIVHVNADDPEACLAAIYIAHLYRQKFHKDFLIDLIGYRRYGHNEMDEPVATNPLLYKKIQKHDTIRKIYADQLLGMGITTKEQIEQIQNDIEQKLKKASEKVPKRKDEVEDIHVPETVSSGLPVVDTGVSEEQLNTINDELIKFPEGFQPFKKLQRILDRRAKVYSEERKVDWSLAEAFAFASILKDGTPIRLTGQDSERGTFAHRHIVLHNVETGENFSPLHHMSDLDASFAVHNSPLSETSVLGFEYGYNVFSPETLVLWEAQFGDFANVAQVMFDQFISAGRAKWGQKSGLVMLLPHGFEGQGPEHSSGRLERYLQLAAENNWTVANVTSAAQYFHILRRQAAVLTREEVRPLIIMTPKSLLRNPHTVSNVNELVSGSFQTIIDQQGLGEKPDQVKRLVLCSGKIAIDLADRVSKETSLDWLHIARIEQLYPFPKKGLEQLFNRFKNLEEIVWVQEEPMNMGSWIFMDPQLRKMAPDGVDVKYIGRPRRSSPAEGDPNVHKKEQNRILTEALTTKALTRN